MLSPFSYVRLCATLWAVACQTPLSMEFSRQEYWSGLPFHSRGDLPDSGIKPWSPALHADPLLPELRWLLSASTTPKTLLFHLLLQDPPLHSACGSHGKNTFCLMKARLLDVTYFYIDFIFFFFFLYRFYTHITIP